MIASSPFGMRSPIITRGHSPGAVDATCFNPAFLLITSVGIVGFSDSPPTASHDDFLKDRARAGSSFVRRAVPFLRSLLSRLGRDATHGKGTRSDATLRKSRHCVAGTSSHRDRKCGRGSLNAHRRRQSERDRCGKPPYTPRNSVRELSRSLRSCRAWCFCPNY